MTISARDIQRLLAAAGHPPKRKDGHRAGLAHSSMILTSLSFGGGIGPAAAAAMPGQADTRSSPRPDRAWR